MTIFYPDIASFQAGIDLTGTLAACAKATQGTSYTNPSYADFKAEAGRRGAFFFAYHFLEHGSAAAQAAHCHRVVGDIPLMLDAEVTGSSRPTLADMSGFVDAFRRLGGIVHLIYLPKWYWRQSPLDGRSLGDLAARGLLLVSSEYTAYSDTGSGWSAYGGMSPVIWQYSDATPFNGYSVDFNAFKGSGGGTAQTLAELRNIAQTGQLAPNPQPGPAPPGTTEEEDYEMNLQTGRNAVTIISFARGSRKWISLASDNTLQGLPDPKVRVAAHSNARGWSQYETLTVHSGSKPSLHFAETDVDCLSLQRVNSDGGENAAVGYNLG